MNQLPDGRPTYVGQPQPTDVDRETVRRLMAAVDEITADKPTAVRVDDPDVPSWKDGARIGATPPVAQPGIPPMSQQATDVGRAAMYCGLATVPPGLIAIGILVASEHADPTVIAWICTAPAALAIPILAIARLMRRVGEAAPAEQHHHYNGPVHQDQRSTTNKTKAVIANTRNQTPR